jgi:hypothetical protein
VKENDTQKKNLYRRWVEGVRSAQEFNRTYYALVEYFSSKWNAVSFDVMADYSLSLQRAERAEEPPWPFGEAERPFGPQEAKAREIFSERYGLDAPPYFFPALDAYKFMAPPWADAVNLSHWRKVLKSAGLDSLNDVYPYLERRKAAQPSAHRIIQLLSEYPGCELEYLDTKRRYMEIRTGNEFLRSGTDAAVAAESQLVYQLSSLDNAQFIIRVSNWGAPRVNPLDVIAAKELDDLGGAPAPAAPIRAKHQRRVINLLRARGIVR